MHISKISNFLSQFNSIFNFSLVFPRLIKVR
nr:MAG TPA: hypothetical protein [Bacteriophage sp.]